MSKSIRVNPFCAAVIILSGWAAVAMGQGVASQSAAQSRIVGPIDDLQVVTLEGNTNPMARAEFDMGLVGGETRLSRMMLLLAPSAAQQAELDGLVAAEHDPGSPLFHRWLTPAEYAARFGVSAQDISRIAGWLAAHGFTVDEIPASSRLILFSGSAAQVADTFHIEIHRYRVNGVDHIANSQDPQIPEALAGVVSGVVSLHDFRRISAIKSRTLLGAKPQYSAGSTHYLFPADWATIYDLNSLYAAGTTGTGSSIAIVGRSNINISDVTAFRTAAGLAANNPTVTLVSTNPGLVSGDQDESTLDVEWSGAVATAATVNFVVGASTATTDGVDLSAQYIVNHQTALVVSTSYGSCEQDMGATELAFYNSLWEQAASQGMSAFVSSGDAGAAGCYSGANASASGTAVNGLCSSPYSTCVGGTEFNEGANPAQYWAAANTTSYESALSYIPEVVWNESGVNSGTGLWASGGGASVVYAQPSWQKGVSGTAASNGMRAVPDVAMSASAHDGYIIYENGSYWVIAGTSAASPSFAGVMALVVEKNGGAGQGNANSGLYPLFNAAHNPFHSTPSGSNSVPGVTGFTASGAAYNLATGLGSVDGAVLVSSWGAGTGTGPSGVDFALTASATGGTVLQGQTAAFTVSVTESGSAKNAVALTATAPTGVTVTFKPASITPGKASTVTITVASAAAVGAQTVIVSGSDASGTQAVNYGLTVTVPATLTLTPGASSLAVTAGSSGAIGFTAGTAGSFAGDISFSVRGLPSGVTAAWSQNPITPASGSTSTPVTLTLSASASAPGSSATVTVTAAGDGLTATKTVTVQVQPAPGVTLSISPAKVSMQSMGTAMVTVTATPVGGVTLPGAASGSTIGVVSGLPQGITATFSAAALSSSGAAVWNLTLTGSMTAASGSSTLSLSTRVLSKTGAVYAASQNLPMSVTLTPPTLKIAAASPTVSLSRGKKATDVITWTTGGTFSGVVTLSVGGLPSGVTPSWSANPTILSNGGGSSTLTLSASSLASVGAATATIKIAGDGLTATTQIRVTVERAAGIQPVDPRMPAVRWLPKVSVL